MFWFGDGERVFFKRGRGYLGSPVAQQGCNQQPAAPQLRHSPTYHAHPQHRGSIEPTYLPKRNLLEYRFTANQGLDRKDFDQHLDEEPTKESHLYHPQPQHLRFTRYTAWIWLVPPYSNSLLQHPPLFCLGKAAGVVDNYHSKNSFHSKFSSSRLQNER